MGPLGIGNPEEMCRRKRGRWEQLEEKELKVIENLVNF